MGTRVYIGKEYEAAFTGVIELYKNGFVSRKIIESADPAAHEIVYRGTTFVLDRTGSRSEDNTYAMERDGASWFRAVRERTVIDSSVSDWLALIDEVATEYHQQNSFLVFKQKKRSFDVGKVDEQKTLIESFFRTFYPGIGLPRIVHLPDDESASIDIFGLNFLMDVNNGVGESKKILGKVFFKYVNRHYYLLEQAEGAEIEKQINEIIETDDFDDAVAGTDKENDRIIGEVLSNLDYELKKNDFSKSVIFTGKEDQKIIDDYVASGPQLNVELDCLHLRVIGIYHIKWSNQSYRVEVNSTPLLNVQITSNNRMTVSCARCVGEEDAVLMVDDKIEYEENGQKKTVRIDIEKQDLGLSEKQIELIRESSNIGRHLLPVYCRNVDPRHPGVGCSKTVCARDSFETEDGFRYCRDCEYPAVVCEDFNREAKVTDSMEYASDARAFAARVDLHDCERCGRHFLQPFSAGSDLCPLCEKVDSDLLGKDENLFAGYRDLFPISRRLFVKRAASAAVQDSEVIVFRLRVFGRDKYYKTDKLDLQKKGYLGGPKRIHVRGGNR